MVSGRSTDVSAGGATPMLSQYLAVKERHPDALLFFRLGDFYELFFEDARIAARELEITLTSRDGKVPMCGVPWHAAEGYLARLVSRGHKVAVCEQLEDPAQARGILRREVVRVVTPGTLTAEGALEAGSNNFLLALAGREDAVGLAAADLSTGELMLGQFEGEGALGRALDEVGRLAPAECLLEPALAAACGLEERVRERVETVFSAVAPERFLPELAARQLREHLGVATLAGYGCEDKPLAVAAAGAVLAYLQETQQGSVEHLRSVSVLDQEDALAMDETARRHLELIRRPDGERRGSLLWVLDRTTTACGARTLRRFLERPLRRSADVRRRADAVEELVRKDLWREDLRATLRQVRDLERLGGRVSLGTAGPRDLGQLAASVEVLPRLRELATAAESAVLRELAVRLDPLEDLGRRLRSALAEELPLRPGDGGIIRDGFSTEVDELRRAARQGKDWVARLEGAEREATGIRSLKVGYNKVFGYYLEVSHANRHLVPERYQRRQTLAGAERYVTGELKEQEERILGAEERLLALEERLFRELAAAVAQKIATLLATARAVGELDALASLAEAAAERGYVRAEVVDGPGIEIREGRHPVLEVTMGAERFVPNDCRLDEGRSVLLITGPNMGGKSTYMRQVALIVLLAQVAGFVPARAARIGVADRIFTRVGASDDLAGGMSTFMTEMAEVARILHQATPRSLVILDEIGRGTSTYDGLAIAWAVLEHLHEHPARRARTLFATHYHELTALADSLPRAANLSVAVREQGAEVRFLHRVVEGAADRSYGIQVARLAGVPPEVLRRAEQLLAELESSQGVAVGREASAPAYHQLSLFRPGPDPVIQEILALDPFRMTPLEALNKLYELRERIRREGV